MGLLNSKSEVSSNIQNDTVYESAEELVSPNKVQQDGYYLTHSEELPKAVANGPNIQNEFLNPLDKNKPKVTTLISLGGPLSSSTYTSDSNKSVKPIAIDESFSVKHFTTGIETASIPPLTSSSAKLKLMPLMTSTPIKDVLSIEDLPNPTSQTKLSMSGMTTTEKNKNIIKTRVISRSGCESYEDKFNQTKIKQIAHNFPSEKVVSFIYDNLIAFTAFLHSKNDNDQHLHLIIKILLKVQKSSAIDEKNAINKVLCDKRDFLSNLYSYVTSIIKKSDDFQENSFDFFKDVANLFKCVLLSPNIGDSAYHMEWFLTTCRVVVKKLNSKFNKFYDVLKELDRCKEDLNKYIRDMEVICYITNNMMIDDDVEPPDDYRDISLYPQPQDLEQFNFLRQNIIKGSYRDVKHYLDVQFRLLREDFIDPLREGIIDYKKSLQGPSRRYNRKEDSSIHIYKNVKFLKLRKLDKMNEISYDIQLDKTWASKIKWEYSRRLLFGSLVMFSNDDFHHIQFGVIVDRDIVKKCPKGIITVALVGEDVLGSEIHCQEFVMAESDAFFEPVHQTLKAVQNIPLDNLPMERYLLVQDITPKRPPYTTLTPRIHINEFSVSIDDDHSWPTGDELGLNPSQLDAIKSAMRQEFVVIQGPPGTGKTFVGLKIVDTLLANFYFESPILMVSYTNHALDQFLEGILDLRLTDRLVRIGGRCVNEALEDYNYRVIKEKVRNREPVFNNVTIKKPRLWNPMVKLLRNEAKFHYKKIKEDTNTVKAIENKEGVIDLTYWNDKVDVFIGVDPEKFGSYDDLLSWLIGDLYFVSIQSFMSEFERNKAAKSQQSMKNSDVPEELGEIFDDEDLRRLGYMDPVSDELWDIFETDVGEHCNIFTLEYLNELSAFYEERISIARAQRWSENDVQMIIENYETVLVIKDIIKTGLSLSNNQNNSEKDYRKNDLDSMSFNEKWQLYNEWALHIQVFILARLEVTKREYESCLGELRDLRIGDDVAMLRALQPQVLGLTTTGAARLHKMLEEVAPRVIIIEEAAEVLEAHVIASLTSSCEHLILIGDHKQLRPSPSTFQLAKEFNLDISLFERMVKNGVGCNTLTVQHRMKPNIASLITPTIYPVLESHPDVELYPPVLGVTKNLYFLHHIHPEEKDNFTESKCNRHEAEFMLSFCNYLIQQGYHSSDITILTTYSSQMYLLKELRRTRDFLHDVKITVVDNYQGEEAKIILLSLVRNNNDGQIGYLKIENRICVALSRAKHGFYMMGNITLLSKKSDTWKDIYATLQQQNAIGESLELVCRIHGTLTQVKSKSDFNRVKAGGCNLPCSTGQLLTCGHTCPYKCHPLNPEHIDFMCPQPCKKTKCERDRPHPCPLQCYMECEPCQVLTNLRLPGCGHTVKVPCHMDPSEFECNTMVNKKLLCGHFQQIACSEDIDSYECKMKCNEEFICGHICQKFCYEDCGDCTVMVTVETPCGHKQIMECWLSKDNVMCTKKCSKKLPCGHPCQRNCGQECSDCIFEVDKMLDCGHKAKVHCSKFKENSPCNARCGKSLPCGHKCTKKCRYKCFCIECQIQKSRPRRN